jgi:PilZ domain
LFNVKPTAVRYGTTSREHLEMATRTGRVEKRTQLEVPMQISRLREPGSRDLTEKTITENVSTHGVRVLTKRALPPQERLLVISSIGSEEPIPARVIYCQPLAEGVFGVGLQFEKGEATA